MREIIMDFIIRAGRIYLVGIAVVLVVVAGYTLRQRWLDRKSRL